MDRAIRNCGPIFGTHWTKPKNNAKVLKHSKINWNQIHFLNTIDSSGCNVCDGVYRVWMFMLDISVKGMLASDLIGLLIMSSISSGCVGGVCGVWVGGCVCEVGVCGCVGLCVCVCLMLLFDVWYWKKLIWFDFEMIWYHWMREFQTRSSLI